MFTWKSKLPTFGDQQHRYIDTSRHGVILGWAFDGTVLSHGIAKCVRAALQIPVLPTLHATVASWACSTLHERGREIAVPRGWARYLIMGADDGTLNNGSAGGGNVVNRRNDFHFGREMTAHWWSWRDLSLDGVCLRLLP